jgi:hypothetical protein
MIGLNILARSSMRLSIVEFPVSHRLTDGFRGSIAHAWTEVDEGLAPSVHRQSRPKGIAECFLEIHLRCRLIPMAVKLGRVLKGVQVLLSGPPALLDQAKTR